MLKRFLAALLVTSSATGFADMQQAQLALKQGHYDAAMKEFTAMGNAGDMSAQIILGALYNKGGVIPRDDHTAAKWIEKAAQQGNPEAQFQLGSLYEDSQLPRDFTQAFNWYFKAAQKGSAKAQVRLGHFYSRGLGVKPNQNEAVLWYGKAALQQNADAQYSLGLLYALGNNFPKDERVAIEWLTKSAAQHHADAEQLLGDIYLTGANTHKRPVLAHALYELAIRHNTTTLKDAMKKRDGLASKMPPEQLEYSKQLIEEMSKPNNFAKTINQYLEKSEQMFRFFDRPN